MTQKIYKDAEYRKQLLLRVLPKFEKLDQFDELHNDFVTSIDEADGEEAITDSGAEAQMAVSKGAAQLLRQINLSLGRDSSSSIIPAPSALQ